MTIFKKMLLVPVLSLILYGSFIIYSYLEQQQSSEKISEIREHYLPLLEITNESENLFYQIRGIYKDSVVANESEWLPQAREKSQNLLRNLDELMHYIQIIERKEIEQLKISFSLYHQNVELLTQKVLINAESLVEHDELVNNIERYHNDTELQFTDLKLSIKSRFHQTIDETSQVMNTLLFFSSFFAIGLLIFLLITTLYVTLTTYRSFSEVSLRMKELALGGTDFSRRLVHNNHDELGHLIHWFNKLSDKLEQDYLHLEQVSITDKLTQLNNRTRTDNYFPQAIKEAEEALIPLCVILIDIDHFKHINDKFGHLVGDHVLKCFAQVLKDNAMEDSFIGRWGGEEFILINSRMNRKRSNSVANDIREKIATTHFEGVGQVTASFGISLFNRGDTPDAMMQRADQSLYKAKANGRNCVVVENKTCD